jgi:5-formyltetrahydrofolate cyclo-ligase
VAFAKHEVRLRIRSLRDAIGARQAQLAADAAASHLLALPAAAAARMVALYAPTRGELDTGPAAAVLQARGLALAYPRIQQSGRRLAFHHVADPRELSPGMFGILEPPRSAPRIPAERIDLFIVPGIAFGPDGARIGWGKGYYDATLATSPLATRVGYAYDCQIVDEVPRSPADAPMHFLITESGARDCGLRAPGGR